MRRLLWLALVACAPPASATFAIPGLGLTLELPVGTEAALVADGATFATRPGARVPRRISVHAGPAAGGDRWHPLAADVAVRYAVRVDAGGSGGEEATLTGALRVGERAFAVACDDQGEPPDPTWCLAWLATARATAP